MIFDTEAVESSIIHNHEYRFASEIISPHYAMHGGVGETRNKRQIELHEGCIITFGMQVIPRHL